MKRLGLLALALLGIAAWLHRSLVHQVVVDTAIGLAALAGLCVAAYFAKTLAGHRTAVPPARYRAVTQPAVPPASPRPRASRPADPCTECGRPAIGMFERWPVCDECGGRLDAPAARAAGRTVVHEPVGDVPRLTMPPVIPAGETIGTVDMTEFEKRASG